MSCSKVQIEVSHVYCVLDTWYKCVYTESCSDMHGSDNSHPIYTRTLHRSHLNKGCLTMSFFEKKSFDMWKQCYKPGHSGSGCSRHQSSLYQNSRAYSTVFHLSKEIFSKTNIVKHPLFKWYLCSVRVKIGWVLS